MLRFSTKEQEGKGIREICINGCLRLSISCDFVLFLYYTYIYRILNKKFSHRSKNMGIQKNNDTII